MEPVAFGAGRVIVGTLSGNILLLNALNGEIAATISTYGPVVSTPAVLGNRAFVGSMDRRVYCVDLTTASLV